MIRRNALLILALIFLTSACLWPVGRLGFISYDDGDYVYQNPVIQSGLNSKSFLWAFTTAWSSNWHPLTWLSLMLDCQLFGPNPQEMHWVNLAFHTINTVLVFLWLNELTAARWRSFGVATLFAIHPLHIQSVAWISERKDVLSGFFCLLTLMAYTRYVRAASVQKLGNSTWLANSKLWYTLTLLLFILGLLAKPMLVTLPLVMLLLDFWPLQRLGPASPGMTPEVAFVPNLTNVDALTPRPGILDRLSPLMEKLPLFMLALASCLATLWAQNTGGSIASMGMMPWDQRCFHALLSYSLYLGKLFWPVNLAIYYPFIQIKLWQLIALMTAPVLLSILFFWRRKSHPCFLVGWLWYVLMLLPVIGLVQVGMQRIADRYTYLPAIGIFIAVVWPLGEIAIRWPTGRMIMTGLAASALLACGLDTRYQLRFWTNSITLFQHAVEVTPENNYEGWYELGTAYAVAGDSRLAEASFQKVVDHWPQFKDARFRLGLVVLQQKDFARAEEYFRESLTSTSDHDYHNDTHLWLGDALVGMGKIQAAQAEYEQAQEIQHWLARGAADLSGRLPAGDVNATLAGLFAELTNRPVAFLHLEIAALKNAQGKYAATRDHFEAALALKPGAPDIENNLAWFLATCPDASVRNGQRAVMLAEDACQASQYKTTIYVGTLAAAYAEAGRFNDAIATAQKACASATAKGEADLLEHNQKLLNLYQQHKAYHEPATDTSR